MSLDIEKMRYDMKLEIRRFVVQAATGAIAAIGSSIAIGGLIWGH